MDKTIRIILEVKIELIVDRSHGHYAGLGIGEVIETTTGGTKIDIEKAILGNLQEPYKTGRVIDTTYDAQIMGEVK